MKHLPIMIVVLSVALPAASIAATASGSLTGSGTALTGSGATDTGTLLQEQIVHLENNLQKYPVTDAAPALSAAKLAEWQSDVEQYKQRSTQLRSTCFDSIRRANKDTIIQTASQCLRGDLTENISFLERQRAYVSSLPGLTPTVESGALAAIDALSSAETTVVNAIDAKLYTQLDQMESVKQKLASQYRTPLWHALVRVKTDHDLTWIHFMLKDLQNIMNDGSGTSLIQNSALEAVHCLDASRQAFENVSADADPAAASGFTLAQNGLTNCRTDLWTVAHLKERQREASTSSASSQTAGR